MRVLVTGATGLVGSHVAAALTREGSHVRALVRDQARLARAMSSFDLEVESVVGDMTDAGAVRAAMVGCDAVVHAAAEIGVHRGSSAGLESNLVGARVVLDAAAEAEVGRVVYTSSVAAYLPSATGVIDPETPLAAPLSPYARSKHEVEMLIRTRQAAGAPVTTLVLGAVYGPPSPHPEQSYASILGALRSGMMATPPSGVPVIDARDLGRLVAAAVASPVPGPRHFMAGGTFVTWPEWVALLEAASGREIKGIDLTTDQLLAMGRQQDDLRASGSDATSNLSVEAATIMTCGCPSDDSATTEALGVTYRPLLETFADTVTHLRERGLGPGTGQRVSGEAHD